MSTVPGESTWVDAGLVPTDDELRETEEERERHVPSPARPDLADRASEPDVVEQAIELGDDGEDDYPEA